MNDKRERVYWRDKECKGIVYVATNKINGKQYVGITRRPLSERISSHISNARRGNGSPQSIWTAIREYGENSFAFLEVAKASTLGELSDKECDLISTLSTLSPNGYNQNKGGSVAPGGEVYQLEGREFWGLTEIADYYGLVEITVHKRFAAGWSLMQVAGLAAPPQNKRKGTNYIVVDQIFRSETALCEFFNVSLRLFRQRIHWNNWSLDEALGLTERYNRNMVIVGDQIYENLSEACRIQGKNYSKIRSRLKLGWSFLEAFDLVKRISPGNVHNVDKKKISTKSSFFPACIENMVFESVVEIASFYNLNPSTVSYRIKNKWTPKEVAGIDKRIMLGSHSTEVFLSGISYPSLTIACRQIGVSRSTVESRLRYGWSIEAAFGIKKHLVIKNVYVITHPDGRQTTTHNLSNFSKQHKLPNHGNLALTINHQNRFYLGYSARKATNEEMLQYAMIISSDSEIEVKIK